MAIDLLLTHHTLDMSASYTIPKALWVEGASPYLSFLVSGLFLGLAWLVVPRLASDWMNDPGASHGLLIPPLVAYLLWSDRRRILHQRTRIDLRGLILTACACLTFLVGRVGVEYYTSRISLLLIGAGLLWTLWGIPRLRLVVPSLLLIASSVPLPEILYTRLAIPLQLLASDLSTQILQALGATVYREGNIIHLPSISLGIEEACSGLRSLSTLLTTTLLVGFIQFNRVLPRVLLFVASIPISIGVNLMRIVGTALLAAPFPEVADGFYHAFTGWLLFIVGTSLMWLLSLLLGRLLNRRPSSTCQPA